MSVTLCKRTLRSGNIQFYLAIYSQGEGKSFETLFTVKPTEMKEKNEIAKAIRSQREVEILSKGTIHRPSHKKNLSIFTYLDDYQCSYEKLDFKMIESVIKKFKIFLENRDILIKDFTENHLIKFINFLNSDPKLKGETPHSYYKRFKKIILQANRDELVDEKVYKNVRFKRKGDYSHTKLSKQVLTEEEIQILFDTPCGNETIKRAFLFSCYSGLGYAEYKLLKWSNIVNNRLIIDRAKVANEINLALGDRALGLLGERGMKDELIFNFQRNGKFLSDAGINKTLGNWLKKAKIDKHITFYCGRHTFATRLLIKGANLKTVSDALAHSTTENTIKYLKYVDSIKDDATMNLD